MHHEAQRRDLCEKIERWRGWNEFNEQATIQGIILPVLELAGYDTRNPEEVLPQGSDSLGNRPDLKLYKTSPLDNGNEWCVIEAKVLGAPLNNYVAQVGQYLIASKAPWYILTDGYEWRFFDKNHPQNNFYRTSILLRQPGALDALRCLLDKERDEPDFDCASQTLIEARLREAARRRPWDKQYNLWCEEIILVKPLRDALEEVSREFDEYKDFITQWRKQYEKSLCSEHPPEWWKLNLPSQPTAVEPIETPQQERSNIDNNCVCIAELRRQPLSHTVPQEVKVNGQHIPLNANKWAQVLMAVLKLLDKHNCLPQPPFPSRASGTGLLYDKEEHDSWEKHSREQFESKQYGKILYVNKHGSSEYLVKRMYALLNSANCPSITPETVCVVYEQRQK